MRDSERPAQPVLERAAVLVRARIGEGRDKFVQEIAVRAMNLDEVDWVAVVGRSVAGN